MFEPIDASSTYEETIARLGTAIRIGVLAPASKLPPERELAEQLHISRSTLRQALATLTASGHLTAVRGRLGGTFVSEAPPISGGRRLPRERWPELLERRVALELGAAQLAAERASDEDLDRLEAAQGRLEAEIDGPFAAYRRADIAFHLALAESAGAAWLVDQVARLHDDLTDLFLEVGEAEGSREPRVAEHRPVLEALRARDAARVVVAVRAHLAATEELFAAPA